MNEGLTEAVEHWLTWEGNALLGQSQRPTSVNVRLASTGTVFLADLVFPQGRFQVAVKQVSAGAVIRCPERLCRIHEAIRARHPLLARGLPAFLGFELKNRLVAMEFIAGKTLRDQLWHSLWLPRWNENERLRWLREAGEVLAALHDLEAEELDVPCEARPNHFFITALEEGWKDPAIQQFLPKDYLQPEALYRRLPESFFDGSEKKLTPVDAQTKNTLVTAGGEARFIDMDYVGGSSAVAVAYYLSSLDRIGLRHPFGWHSARTAVWKQAFLDGYARSRPAVVGDLVFFYPWALMKNYRQLVGYRPWSRWYLARLYGRRLRAFLEQLQRNQPAERFPNLFAMSPAAARP